MLEGEGPGGVPPRHICCVQARDKICDPAPRGVLERGSGGGKGPGGFPPPVQLLCPSTRPAAVSKHEIGNVTRSKQPVLYSPWWLLLCGEGGCYTSANIYHFVMPWEAGGASPNQHASDLYYNF